MHRTLVIVPCGQQKIWDKHPSHGPAPACEVYTGAPFIVNRAYAQHFGDQWVILSAKYGFILPDFVISSPYNITFKRQASNPVTVETLREQIRRLDLERFDQVIGLGGKEYRSMIEQAFVNIPITIVFPFAGLPLGRAMQAIKHAMTTVSSRVEGLGEVQGRRARNGR